MKRRLTIAIVVLVAAGTAIAIVRPFRHRGGEANAAENTTATSLATVTRRDLTSQTQVDGTLGYGGSYHVVNQAAGSFTWLPGSGAVIQPGHALYRVDGKPVVLLAGHVPAYRALSSGMSGRDVLQLNADLVALGYATSDQIDPTSDYFSSATAAALERLQRHLGLSETGTLPLGQAVFLPEAVRITSVSATLGGAAQAGTPVASASSTRRSVSVAIDATQQGAIKPGDRVDITLPDNSVTTGVVASVGSVATTPSGSGDPGSDNTPQVTVTIRPLHPRATGRLDQAPVQVGITTDTARNALVVPVAALLARGAGGYAIEVAGGATRRLVPVQLGLFDDADGLVQISGAGVEPGQRVIVPGAL